MNVIDKVAADLAALEEDLRRVPMRALREGDALVEWMDGIRERVWHARCSLTGDFRLNPKTKSAPKSTARMIVSASGNVVPIEPRLPRAPRR